MKKVGTVFFFILLGLLFLHPIDSGDFFHHLNSGRYIVENRRLPYTDDLTFTVPGKPWVAYAWGIGLVFYAIYTTLGAAGISVLFALIGIGTLLCTYLTLRAVKTPYVISIILTFLAGALVSLRFPTRPEVLGPFFISILVYFLARDKELTWKLPPLFLGWGILYGSSAILGMGILIFFALTLCIRDPKHDWRKTLLILPACFVASMANGIGLKGFFYIFQIPAIAPHVGEWLPLTATMDVHAPGLVLFYQYTVLSYLLFVVLYLVALLIIAIKRPKIITQNLFLAGLSLGFLAPFFTNRLLNLAPLIVIPFFGVVITQMRKKMQWIVASLACILAIAGTVIRFTNFSFGSGVEHPFQNKAVAFLKAHAINGNIYENQELGAFIAWEIPKSKIFVDTRDDLFQPTSVFGDLTLMDAGNLPAPALMDKYGAGVVIGDLSNEPSLESLFYSPEWKLVFLTDGYFVAVRSAIAIENNLQTYAAIDPLRPDGAKPGQEEQARREIQSLVTQDPSALENQVRLIKLYLGLGNPVQAKMILEHLRLSPAGGPQAPILNLDTQLLIAQVYLATRDCDLAYRALQTAQGLTQGKLIFFPRTTIASPINRLWGQYYGFCTGDTMKARSYFYKFLQGTGDPLEKRQVEREIETLNNK